MSGTALDHYDIYYADKLWNLLPATYRALDTDQFGSNGPLRELVNRIGATAATLRRSIDRLWEDQSIESCDDWVIPYIAQLLDTRLVYGLDARGQRLDVANTIDYRRRKGTLGVLEQIASDITGWDAKIVEFFRRLGRTRHLLDPAIGNAGGTDTNIAQLQQAQGLAGLYSGTKIGGFADLRNVHAASLSSSAFDEFFHTADLRAPLGNTGWYTIPNLGVFIWRLNAYPVGPVTPVPVQGCPGWYCFDPTGRNIPLFAPRRSTNQFGAAWVSPLEGQMPGPISQSLLDADIAAGANGLGLYPNAIALFQDINVSPPLLEPIPASELLPQPPGVPPQLLLRPDYGRFYFTAASPATPVVGQYVYGFPSDIGAGSYDRRGQEVTVPTPAPVRNLQGGGSIGALPTTGTLALNDCLTYDGVTDVSVNALTIQGGFSEQTGLSARPLLQLSSDQVWHITGLSADATLNLDGLFISGGEILLQGQFASVTITCSTLDPGTASPGPLALPANASPPSLFAENAAGLPLAPVILHIEAEIETLCIDRSVLGPVRTAGAGEVATMQASNSIIQGIRTSAPGALDESQVKDMTRFVQQLQLGLDPVSAALRALSPALANALGPISSPPLSTPKLQPADDPQILTVLNTLIAGPPLPQAAFANVALSSGTQAALAASRPHAPAPVLNRLLLEDAYPLELADAALAFGDGSLILSRCTILGRIAAHRLQASECILHELTTVDDTQDGCIRFTAFGQGSRLPRQYESVAIPQQAPLFTSTSFGAPAYGQLRADADKQILPQTSPSTTPQNSISAGAEDGSEMGAYARDKNPIRAEALLLKYQEYMPAGLVPVIINVT
jgi:hypothetical protein